MAGIKTIAINNVMIFDGKNSRLKKGSVLFKDNLIDNISSTKLKGDKIIDGNGMGTAGSHVIKAREKMMNAWVLVLTYKVDKKTNNNQLRYFKLEFSLFLSFVLLVIGIIVYFYQITLFTINSNFISIFFIFFSIINIFYFLIVSLVELIAKKWIQ